MSLVDNTNTDLAAAQKSGSSDVVAVLRSFKASLKNEEIKLGHAASDDEAMKVMTREAKQRRDSIAAYEAGGRQDLADAEKLELAIIEGYLPQQMSDEELGKLVDQAISETGATDMAAMGQVIGKVMASSAGRAEGGAVSRLVKERLS